MRILISNDDGIFSPGILALAQVASNFGEVRIVAPDVEQSAQGHAITIMRPLHYHKTKLDGFEAFRVDGTPADCVALGIFHWSEIDLVLSGINLGLNIGNNIWHSGTVAAARQAVFHNIPAIAISAPNELGSSFSYDVFKPFIEKIIEDFTKTFDNKEVPREARLLNVNLPLEPKGTVYTRQSIRHYEGHVVPDEDPLRRKHYWFSLKAVEEVEEGTDRWAVENNLISVTPINLDLTDKSVLEKLNREVLT